MDRSTSPWRALEGAPGAATEPDRETGRRGLRWPLVGGAVAAFGFGLAALALVVSGPTPAAIVGVGVDPIAAIDPSSQSAAPGSSGRAAISPPAAIVVHVSGAVRRPGIVHLQNGARVADAIEAAGGVGPRVDAARFDRDINLAAPVGDGDHIVVPSRDDAPAGSSSAPAASSGRIDLNHASAEALDALPGIGPATAAKIIAGREERPYRTLDELVSRKILGQATLTRIRDLVELR
ncbi:MAG TPA: ComEA family DNA-binding protein [Candidatus Dormibacteraeota bacterium]|nr:ComEA family DNA-binding protein [Candidatus Dormibacteraeota bacterium]